MEYSIAYTKNGHLTKHCYKTTNELKNILKGLKGTMVKPMIEGMPKNMYMLCIEHNITALPSESFDVAANTSMNLRKANRQ
jgi:hypothetical protein